MLRSTFIRLIVVSLSLSVASVCQAKSVVNPNLVMPPIGILLQHEFVDGAGFRVWQQINASQWRTPDGAIYTEVERTPKVVIVVGGLGDRWAFYKDGSVWVENANGVPGATYSCQGTLYIQ